MMKRHGDILFIDNEQSAIKGPQSSLLYTVGCKFVNATSLIVADPILLTMFPRSEASAIINHKTFINSIS